MRKLRARRLLSRSKQPATRPRRAPLVRTYPGREGETGAQNSSKSTPLLLPLPTAFSPRHPHTFRFEHGLYKYTTGVITPSKSIQRILCADLAAFKVYSSTSFSLAECRSVRNILYADEDQPPANDLSSLLRYMYQLTAKAFASTDSVKGVFFQLFRGRGSLRDLRLPWTAIGATARQWNLYCQLYRTHTEAATSVPQIRLNIPSFAALPPLKSILWNRPGNKLDLQINADLRPSVLRGVPRDRLLLPPDVEVSTSPSIQDIVDDLLRTTAPIVTKSLPVEPAKFVRDLKTAVMSYLKRSDLHALLEFRSVEVILTDAKRQRYVSSVLLNSDGSQRGVRTQEPVSQQSAIILGGGVSVNGVSLSGPTREKIGADTANANVDTAPGASVESCSMSVTEYIQEFDNICRTSHETGLKCCLVAANRLAQSNEDSSGTLHINCNPSETKDLLHGASISIEWNKTPGQTYMLLRIPVSSMEVRMVTSDAVNLQFSNITLRYALPEIEDDQLEASEAKRETAMDEVSTINQALNSVCENVVEKAEFASLDEIPVRLAEAVIEVLHLPHFGITLKKVHVSVRPVNDPRSLYRGEASIPSGRFTSDQSQGRHMVTENSTSNSIEPYQTTRSHKSQALNKASRDAYNEVASHVTSNLQTSNTLRWANQDSKFFEHFWRGSEVLKRHTGFDSFMIRTTWPNSNLPTSVEPMHFKTMIERSLEVSPRADTAWLQAIVEKLSNLDPRPSYVTAQISASGLQNLPALSGIPFGHLSKPQLVLQLIKHQTQANTHDLSTDHSVTFLLPAIVVSTNLTKTAATGGRKVTLHFRLVGVSTQRKLSDDRTLVEHFADLIRSVYDTTTEYLNNRGCDTLQEVANKLTDRVFGRRCDLSASFGIQGIELKASTRVKHIQNWPVETVFAARRVGLDGVGVEVEVEPITSSTKPASFEQPGEALESDTAIDSQMGGAPISSADYLPVLAFHLPKTNAKVLTSPHIRSDALIQHTGFNTFRVQIARYSPAHGPPPNITIQGMNDAVENTLALSLHRGVSSWQDLLTGFGDLASSAPYITLELSAFDTALLRAVPLSGSRPELTVLCFKYQSKKLTTMKNTRDILIRFPGFTSRVQLENQILSPEVRAHLFIVVEGAFTKPPSSGPANALEEVTRVFEDVYGMVTEMLHHQAFLDLATLVNSVSDTLYHKQQIFETIIDVREFRVSASLREGTHVAPAIARASADRKLSETTASERQSEAIDKKNFLWVETLSESEEAAKSDLDSKPEQTTLSILGPMSKSVTTDMKNVATPKLHTTDYEAPEQSAEEETAQELVEHHARSESPWRTAFIALGSNLGDRFKNIEDACREMDADPGIRIVKTSQLYETEPMYVADQGSFLNGACQIETKLQPLDLLDQLQGIENRLGRLKVVEKGPRSIDLDILMYEGVKMATERLTIPHALMHEREFVLKPLMDFRKARRWPISTGLSLKAALDRLPRTPMHELVPLGPPSQYLRTSDPQKATRVMSVLNTTPDSFSDGGDNPVSNVEALKAIVRSHIEAGASIIDVGGQSSRPNAPDVTAEEEISRILPAIEAIRSIPDSDHVAISVDTYRARVAEAAVGAGANIINDISAGNLDPDMFPTIAKLGCTYIMMHMRGTPATMMNPENCRYEEGLIETMHVELQMLLHQAQIAGVRRWRIVLDPGIGFSKTAEQNAQLLRQFKMLRSGFPGFSWLVGTSRKSFIGKLTGVGDPKQRVWGTAATVTAAVMGGADIVRVHDVKEMADVVKMADAMYRV